MATKLEVGAATALVGASVFQVHTMYAQHAGSLNDARQSPPADPLVAQRLLDADILTGSLTLLVGVTLTMVTRNSAPLMLAAGAFGAVSLYYHHALNNERVEK